MGDRGSQNHGCNRPLSSTAKEIKAEQQARRGGSKCSLPIKTKTRSGNAQSLLPQIQDVGR